MFPKRNILFHSNKVNVTSVVLVTSLWVRNGKIILNKGQSVGPHQIRGRLIILVGEPFRGTLPTRMIGIRTTSFMFEREELVFV